MNHLDIPPLAPERALYPVKAMLGFYIGGMGARAARHWPLLLSAAGKGFRAIEPDPALIRHCIGARFQTHSIHARFDAERYHRI